MYLSDSSSRTRQLILVLCLALGFCVFRLKAQGNAKAEYIGATACGGCHSIRLSQQSASAHARSLFPAADHPLAGLFALKNQFLRNPIFVFNTRSVAMSYTSKLLMTLI